MGTCETRKSDIPWKLADEYNFAPLGRTFWDWGCLSPTVHIVSLRRSEDGTNVLFKYDEDEV